MLKIVGTPSFFRTGATCFIAWCSRGAKQKQMPSSSRHCSTRATPASTLTPKAASTSAEPLRLVAARLPCLATATPAAAVTRAAAVLMLNVAERSPPVPQVSISAACGGCGWGSCCVAWPAAAPATSATVSPLRCKASSSRAIWGSAARPSMIRPRASAASAIDRSRPASTRLNGSLDQGPCSSGNSSPALSRLSSDETGTAPFSPASRARSFSLQRAGVLRPPVA